MNGRIYFYFDEKNVSRYQFIINNIAEFGSTIYSIEFRKNG